MTIYPPLMSLVKLIRQEVVLFASIRPCSHICPQATQQFPGVWTHGHIDANLTSSRYPKCFFHPQSILPSAGSMKARKIPTLQDCTIVKKNTFLTTPRSGLDKPVHGKFCARASMHGARVSFLPDDVNKEIIFAVLAQAVFHSPKIGSTTAHPDSAS